MGIQACGGQGYFPVGLEADAPDGPVVAVAVAMAAAGVDVVAGPRAGEGSAADECSQTAAAYCFCVGHIGLRIAPYVEYGRWQSCPLATRDTEKLQAATGTATCSHRPETHCTQVTRPWAR